MLELQGPGHTEYREDLAEEIFGVFGHRILVPEAGCVIVLVLPACGTLEQRQTALNVQGVLGPAGHCSVCPGCRLQAPVNEISANA